jgi:serine/threonine-protein phosphatase 6 regulatory ankyrin repeat subunit B
MWEIFTAVQDGDEEEVIQLLDADPALLEREDHHGERPLTLAAHYGHLGVVSLLVERGADINVTGHGGNTALDCAAMGGHEDVVALLLSKGAHANTRDNRGMTPFMWASDNGNLRVVRMLVKHMGVQRLDNRSNRGWTALHYATEWGHEEVVRFLLFVGAEPTITDNEGRTPRALAEENHPSSTIAEGYARCVAVFQVRPPTY